MQRGSGGSHLRNWQPNEEAPSFGLGHRKALAFLMKEENAAPEAAIQEIDGLSGEQAGRIAAGETRSQILGHGPSPK